LLTIRCSTPSAKGFNLLVNSFLTPLQARLGEKGRQPNRPYYVGRAQVVNSQKLKERPALARPAVGFGPGPGGPPVAPGTVDPLKDPQNGEDMGDDLQATLLIGDRGRSATEAGRTGTVRTLLPRAKAPWTKLKTILAKYWVAILCGVIALAAVIASYVPLGKLPRSTIRQDEDQRRQVRYSS